MPRGVGRYERTAPAGEPVSAFATELERDVGARFPRTTAELV